MVDNRINRELYIMKCSVICAISTAIVAFVGIIVALSTVLLLLFSNQESKCTYHILNTGNNVTYTVKWNDNNCNKTFTSNNISETYNEIRLRNSTACFAPLINPCTEFRYDRDHMIGAYIVFLLVILLLSVPTVAMLIMLIIVCFTDKKMFRPVMTDDRPPNNTRNNNILGPMMLPVIIMMA
jgi:hypothetical protein